MEIQLSFFDKVKAKRKIIFNSFWVILDKIIRMLGGLIVGIWVSRYLGPYNFGKINYASSIIAVCLPFVNMGMNNLVLTDMIRTKDQGQILFTALGLKLISGSLMFLGIYLFSFTLHNDHLTRVILIILSLQCIFQSADIFDLFNQSRTESKNTVIAKSSAYIVINIIKAVALIVGFDLVFFAWLTVAETLLGTTILLFFYFKVSRQSISNWVFNAKFAKELLSRSWPLIISDVFITFYMRLDQLMLKSQVGYTEVGRYSAVVRISEMHYFLAGAICISVYPSIIRLKEKSEAEFLLGFQRLFNILTTISVGIALFVTIFASDITHALYGVKYPNIGPILAVHIWTGVFVFLGVGASNWFFVNNYQRYILIFTIIGLSFNVILNLVLIPRYQSLGSAVATLISQMFAAVVANSFVKKTRPIFWLQIRSFLVFISPSLKNYI
jgi:PST family polysaccharide transporter